MYARARRCREVLTSPQQVMTPSHSADSSQLPSDPNRVAVPLSDAGVESLKQPDPVVRSFSDDQKQVGLSCFSSTGRYLFTCLFLSVC